MFGLEGILKRWKDSDTAPCRLAPLDAWAENGPLAFTPPAVIGRSTRADIRLNDPWVSRVHCELSLRDGQLVVRDLESRHGVYVNDQRVMQSVLHPGDVLLLGVTRYRVEFDESRASDHQE
jgi:predicted component of type VI protein secretion system